jgi:hypothetical protein
MSVSLVLQGSLVTYTASEAPRIQFIEPEDIGYIFRQNLERNLLSYNV